MNEIDVLKNWNWQTISAMFAITLYFTFDLRRKMKEQGKRIDHLYQICVDLLKEKK
jgi:hypothetical protein